MGPIGNMHDNDDGAVGFGEHAYDWANEEPNDDDYNDVVEDLGKDKWERPLSQW